VSGSRRYDRATVRGRALHGRSAVLAIDAGARDGVLGGAAGEEVTVEVTARITVEGSRNEEPPTTLEVVGGELEREKGFEPAGRS